ncbi:DUF4446 family protein [Candidatus Curtissbacteria bacterium]|nr:DUF4446 family protein [Candidatus Curtissbacteria bacterium]
MENFSFTDLGLIFLCLWLTVVTILLFRVKSNWQKIKSGQKNLNLVQILESILKKQDLTTKNIARLAQEIEQVGSKAKLSFQKSALVRFNPFEDTGGDQSFIIALLNGQNNGIVISSLHSRNGTRVYAKQVIGGRAQQHELSKEEKEVVEKAIKQK